MIILREKYYSIFTLLEKVVRRLDNAGIEDYSIEDQIPRDVISYDIFNNTIYLPKDYEYSQYNIDDYIRTLVPYMRTNTTLDRNIYKMSISGKLSEVQIFKLVKYIAEEEGFCVLINK